MLCAEQALIPAAAASGPFEGTVLRLFSTKDHRLPPGALALIRATPEFIAAERSGIPSDSPRGLSNDGFTTLELRYTQRLSLLRASPDWKRLRPRGTLVDWPLLALEVGLLRASTAKRSAGCAPCPPWPMAGSSRTWLWN